MDSSQKKYLFIHVMKTGGTSFADIIDANFDVNQRYPGDILENEENAFRHMEAYLYAPGILAAVQAQPEKYRIICAHVPYAIRALLPGDYITLSVLRDPITRTISYLKHCRRYHKEHMGLPLEEIYEDEWFNASFMSNYQTKLFSMTPQEVLAEVRYGSYEPALPARSELGDGENLTPELIALGERGGGRFSMECFAASTGVITIDEHRFKRACENLHSTDLVGVTENYDRFFEQLVSRYSWNISAIPHLHAGETEKISRELLHRIEKDNAADIELHNLATSLAN